jgi:hypothetical protein
MSSRSWWIPCSDHGRDNLSCVALAKREARPSTSDTRVGRPRSCRAATQRRRVIVAGQIRTP